MELSQKILINQDLQSQNPTQKKQKKGITQWVVTFYNKILPNFK